MVSGPPLIRLAFGRALSPFSRRGEGLRAAKGRPYGPHPPRFARHLPLKGKACGRPKAAPTAENGPGTLVRRRQAQKRNRASSNFPPAQAPSGAGRNRAQALLILRAGNVLLTSRGNPRNRGPGKGEYERVSAHPEPSPAAKSPCKKRNCSIIAPSSVWPDGQPPSPQGEGSLWGSGPSSAPEGKLTTAGGETQFRTKFFCLLFF